MHAVTSFFTDHPIAKEFVGERTLTRLFMTDAERRIEDLVEDIEEPTLVSVLQFMDDFEADGFVRGQIKSFVDGAYRELLTDGQRERVAEYWMKTIPA